MIRKYKIPFFSREKNKCNLVTHWLRKAELLMMQGVRSKLSVQGTNLETNIQGSKGSKIP